MPNYKEMYQILFHETTNAITTLQKAQQKSEEVYIAGDVAEKLTVISSNATIKKSKKEHPPQK